MYRILTLILLLAATARLDAQSIETNAEPKAGPKAGPKAFEYPQKVLVYDLPKASNGIAYRIYVRPPLRSPEDGEKASAFYFLDPLSLFVPSAVMCANYEYFNYIPPTYFVGIGYADEADGKPKAENRTRDYTPTKFTPPDSTHFLAANPVDYLGSGGTDAFLKVLKQEIIPFVEAEFEINAADRVLVGNSLSGLAATHILMSQPELFNRYLIVSPSLWWDDWSYARHERYFMKQAASIDAKFFKDQTRAYFAVGSEEEGFGMVTDLYLLTNTLKMKRIETLKVHLEVNEGEIHEGIFPSAFMKGILALYSQEQNRRPSPSSVDWKDK